MAKKIKVNISGAAFTGKIVTFKAPCDCTEATGLVIGEDTYDVVDALGNCITGSYLAWRSGAVVSVALDVDSKKAFLQSKAVSVVSNPNLLHNWYFANPVDQRGGYVVPPGTTADLNGDASVIISTDKYYAVTKINGGYVQFVYSDGQTYNTLLNACVRGYVGVGYAIDRWCPMNADSVYEIENGEIMVHPISTIYAVLGQRFEGGAIPKGTYTMSIMTGSVGGTLYFLAVDSQGYDYVISKSVSANSVESYTFTSPNDIANVRFYIDNTKPFSAIAVKLELGSTQTLAHQDANGNWVLNEIPDYGEELRKCQRYQLVLGNEPSSEGIQLKTLGTAYATLENNVVLKIPTPVTMRGTPRIVANANLRFCHVDSSGFHSGAFTPTGFAYVSVDRGMVSIDIAGSGFMPGQVGWIDNGNDRNNYLILDANL